MISKEYRLSTARTESATTYLSPGTKRRLLTQALRENRTIAAILRLALLEYLIAREPGANIEDEAYISEQADECKE